MGRSRTVAWGLGGLNIGRLQCTSAARAPSDVRAARLIRGNAWPSGCSPAHSTVAPLQTRHAVHEVQVGTVPSRPCQKARPPARSATGGLVASRPGCLEGIAVIDITGVEPASKPPDALCRGAVRKGLG